MSMHVLPRIPTAKLGLELFLFIHYDIVEIGMWYLTFNSKKLFYRTSCVKMNI